MTKERATMRRWNARTTAFVVFMALSTRVDAAPSTVLDDYALFEIGRAHV